MTNTNILTLTYERVLDLYLQRNGFTMEGLQKMGITHMSDLHDGLLLNRCEEFIDKLHLMREKNITIVGDYDTDGVMSGICASAGLSLLDFTGRVNVYAPTAQMGYGLTRASVDDVLSKWPDTEVLLTTDNGIKAYDGIAYANSKGLIVMVTDHHIGDKLEPDAECIVNPNGYTDNSYPFKSISGATVIWKVLQSYALKYSTHEVQVKISNLIVFAGISAVGDMMSMLDENRMIVVKSLQILDDVEFLKREAGGDVDVTAYHQAFKGLYALHAVLSDTGKLKYGLDEGTIGFTISPMLNAPRRMTGASQSSFDVFTQSDVKEAYSRSEELVSINELRKAEVKELSHNVLGYYKGHPQMTEYITVVGARGGFAGLVAGRILEAYAMPTIVFTVDSDDVRGVLDDNALDDVLSRTTVLRGSGRSPGWLNMYEALLFIDTTYPGVLASWGGHAEAAGVGVYANQYELFVTAFSTYVAQVVARLVYLREESGVDATEASHVRSDVITLGIEGTVVDDSVDLMQGSDVQDLIRLVDYFGTLGPYGQDFKLPTYRMLFSTSDVRTDFMGAEKQHVKFTLPNGMVILQWNSAQALREELGMKNGPFVFEVCGPLSLNRFRDKTTVQCVADSLSVL